jgi:steroid delta-isomerase-like uncharacterized protein
MSTEENKAVARRLIEEALNTGNFAVLDDLLAPNYRMYFLGMPEPLDREGWQHVATLFRTAFPDLQLTIEDIIAEGNRVALRFTERGTHQGDFQGLAPTGKQVTLTGTVFFRLEDGKLVEDRPLFDRLELLQQLGAMPTPAHAPREGGT